MHTEIVWADTSTHSRGLRGSDSKKHRERWCAVTLVCMQRVIVCVEADTFNNSLYSLHGCVELLLRSALKQAGLPSGVYIVSEEARPKRCWSWKLSFKGWRQPKLKSIVCPYPKDRGSFLDHKTSLVFHTVYTDAAVSYTNKKTKQQQQHRNLTLLRLWDSTSTS